MSLAKKLKGIIKNPAGKETFGTNPLDPWSARANIAEDASLTTYLKSRGINPEFVSKDQKISHAKSMAYLRWKQSHMHEDLTTQPSTAHQKKALAQKSVHAHKEIKSIPGPGFHEGKGSQVTQLTPEETELDEGAFKRIATDREEDARLKKMSALDKFRADAGAREKKHAEIAKKSGGMTAAIDRLEKHLNKEETEHHKEIHVHSEVEDGMHQDKLDTQELHNRVKSAAKKHGATITYQDRPSLHGGHTISAKGSHDFHKEVKHIVSDYEHLGAKHEMNEEVEQIDELKKSTLDSYRDKAMASNKNAKKNRDAAEPGKDMSKGFADLHAKSNAIVKKRIKGLSGYLQRKHGMKPGYEDQRKTTSEETDLEESVVDKIRSWNYSRLAKRSDKKSTAAFHRGLEKGTLASRKDHDEDEVEMMKQSRNAIARQRKSDSLKKEDVGDPKAAVNADGLPNAQLEPVSEKKKQMSKSARIIKALYKKKGMVKEDLYDHEKEDKSVATYGKKPKMDVADKKDSIGEKKPQAAATLSGGKTLTGTERDTVEIDPMMRNRPGQPDITKKDDKKDDKKEDKKKDK